MAEAWKNQMYMLHLKVKRGRTISDSLSMTISSLLGHVTHANDNSSGAGVKLCIYCFTTINGSNRIFLEDTAPLADSPVKFSRLMRVWTGARHSSPLHYLHDVSLHCSHSQPLFWESQPPILRKSTPIFSNIVYIFCLYSSSLKINV